LSRAPASKKKNAVQIFLHFPRRRVGPMYAARKESMRGGDSRESNIEEVSSSHQHLKRPEEKKEPRGKGAWQPWKIPECRGGRKNRELCVYQTTGATRVRRARKSDESRTEQPREEKVIVMNVSTLDLLMGRKRATRGRRGSPKTGKGDCRGTVKYKK